MTREDIIKTAFKVWGQDFYKTTSLSQITRELGVSKPAIYRHFKDKEAVLDAMYVAFYDDFTNYVRKDYEKAMSMEKWQECFLVITRILTEYYVLNRYAFIFSLTQVFSRRDSEKINDEFSARGVNLTAFSRGKFETSVFPSRFHIVMLSLIYHVSIFHQNRRNSSEEILPDELKEIVHNIETQITAGLALAPEIVAALDYKKLENQAAAGIPEYSGENPLLKAVAEAVAEAGPWNVSMEMVARRCGLSKSGLYAHFIDKQDMLSKLFMTEFFNIIGYAKSQIETTELPEEQLYIGIISIVQHLRYRPELLMALDWLKTRHLDLKRAALEKLQEYIASIKLEVVKQQDQQFLLMLAQWILFMIVSIMAWWPSIKNNGSTVNWTKYIENIPNESFRVLFRFIALGFDGLDNVQEIEGVNV